jgi:hypothetical protein
MKENRTSVSFFAHLLSLKPEWRLASQQTKLNICNFPSSESQAILYVEKHWNLLAE